MIIVVLPLLVALIGLLMFVLCVNGKLVRIGEILFACGILAFLIGGGHEAMTLMH